MKRLGVFIYKMLIKFTTNTENSVTSAILRSVDEL